MKWLVFAAVVLVACPAWAEYPTLIAQPTHEAIHMDGWLRERAWQTAQTSTAFVQKFPKERAAPSENTTVQVLYDQEFLYVGVECRQTHHPIVARLTRRDRPVESDSVAIVLDSRNDRVTAFEFKVNAAGVMADGLHFNDTDVDTTWDENWEARVVRTKTGWSTEFRIPLRILRFAKLPVQSWGFQVRRYISMAQETDEWSYIPRDAAGEVSRYGRLQGLHHLKAKGALELRPFLLGRAWHRQASDLSIGEGWRVGGSAGLDAKWHINQRLTLDLTLNPDFGQVEADQQMLNLANYELFFPEKRPFFLESFDLFATPLQLLYTRRIGHAADRPVLRTAAPYREQLVDLPTPARIYAAAKLTGSLSSKVSMAAVFAATERNEVEVQISDVSRVRRIVEPPTLYSALRLRWQPKSNLALGLMATAANRIESTELYPRLLALPGETIRMQCPDGQALPLQSRCFHDAYVVAADGRFRFGNGDYLLAGQLAASIFHQGPSQAMPDGTVISSGDVAPAASLLFAKEGGKHWLLSAKYDLVAPKYDHNDLGYLQRQNLHNVEGFVGFRTLTPWWNTLYTLSQLEFSFRQSWNNTHLGHRLALNSYWELKQWWRLFAGIDYRGRYFDDREVGDGTALQRNERLGLELAFGSDKRKPIVGWFWTQLQWMPQGMAVALESTFLFRPLPQFDFEIAPTGIYTEGEYRYAGEQSGQPLYGRLQAKSFGTTLRITYTFTPRLTLQAYGQFLLSAWHFDQLAVALPAAALPAPRSIHVQDLQMVPVLTEKVDEMQGVFNVNLVLRWEFHLGSMLYLVYTHAQSPDVLLNVGQKADLDFHLLGQGSAVDMLMLKFSYFFNS